MSINDNISPDVQTAMIAVNMALEDLKAADVSPDATLTALGTLAADIFYDLPIAERSIALVLWARGVIEAAEAHCTITVDAPQE